MSAALLVVLVAGLYAALASPGYLAVRTAWRLRARHPVWTALLVASAAGAFAPALIGVHFPLAVPFAITPILDGSYRCCDAANAGAATAVAIVAGTVAWWCRDRP